MDKVTGFKGVTISRVEYLNGCVQYCVKPPVDEDGKMLDGEYIDEQQLIAFEDDESSDVASKSTESPGGSMINTPSDVYTAK